MMPRNLSEKDKGLMGNELKGKFLCCFACGGDVIICSRRSQRRWACCGEKSRVSGCPWLT
jgi:hypothetical protein